jgi:WD40 repeat protein
MVRSVSAFLLMAISVMNVKAQEDEYLVKRFRDHKASVLSVDLSPDGKYLVTGSDDKKLIIYELSNFEILHEYTDNYFPPRAIEVTGDNSIFLGSGSDIRLIDMNNTTLALFQGNTTHIWSVDYAPERNKVTAGSYDYKIKVWDVGTQQIELELEGHKKSTLPVVFSPDEKYLVSGSLDRTVKIWNAKTGEEMRSLVKHTDNIYDIAFHPSGQYFLSASRDKTIRLWDFEKGEVLKTYVGHDQGVVDLEILPDGEHFLSASFDGSVRLWETRTGKMVYTYTGHTGAVNSISVSTGGDLFVSGGIDGQVLLYRIDGKVFVEYTFYDEFMNEKEGNSLFEERRKGEKKEDYESRQAKARDKETEIVEKYYRQYLDRLKKETY